MMRTPAELRSPGARFFRRVAALGTLLVTWFAAWGALAAFDYRDTSWEGSSELLTLARELLGSERVEVRAKLDFATLKPIDGVLLLHPDVELDHTELSAFLAAGGRLALLDDHGSADRLLARYRIHRVQAPLRPAATLRSNPDLPLAFPAVQAVAGQVQNRHPVVARVDRLVTNHPTALTNPNLTPVLTIPAMGEPDATLALTGVIAGRGRLFAMADPSAVMNLMLRYPGNRAFAAGLVEYLVEDDTWGERGGKLYVLANRFGQSGRFGRSEGLSSDLAGASASVAEAVASLHRDGLPAAFALALAAIAGLAAIVWAAHFALRSYRPVNPRFAQAAPLIAQGGLPGRAAVLSASTTDKALVVAELDGLLNDELAARLGFSPVAGPDVAIEKLREREGDRPVVGRARELLLRGRSARNALLERRPSRITAGQLADHGKKLEDLLRELDRSGK